MPARGFARIVAALLLDDKTREIGQQSGREVLCPAQRVLDCNLPGGSVGAGRNGVVSRLQARTAGGTGTPGRNISTGYPQMRETLCKSRY